MAKSTRDYGEEAELRRIEIAKPWNQRGIVVARLADISRRYKQKLKLFKKVYNEEATLLELIEAKCLDCQMMNYDSAKSCTAPDCPLWSTLKKILKQREEEITKDQKIPGGKRRKRNY